jgi:hypothetical protein
VERTRTFLEAAEKGRVSLLVESLKKGADINDKDDAGMTALHRAAAAGQKSAVIALLALGADMSETDNQGRTPLMLAAEAGHTEVLQLLVWPSNIATLGRDILKAAGGTAKGADELSDRLFGTRNEAIRRTDNLGQSVHHKAAAGGHTACLDVLVEQRTGYSPLWGQADKQGHTPLALAEAGKHERAAAVIRKVCAVVAAGAGDLDAVTAFKKQLGNDFPAPLAMTAAVQGAQGKVVAFLKDEWKDKPLSQKQALMEGGQFAAIYAAVTINNAELTRAVLDRAWWKDDTALREYITLHRSDSTPLTEIEYLSKFYREPMSVIASVLKDLDTKK